MKAKAEQVGWLRRTAAKLLGFNVASWSDLFGGIAAWQGRSAEDVTRPFEQVVHAYRALRVIQQTMATANVVLTRGDSAEPLTRGPAWELLNWPGAGLTLRDLLKEFATYMPATGECYVLDRDLVERRAQWNPNRGPTSLLLCGGNEMTPRRDREGGRVLWWEYCRGSVSAMLPPERVHYTRVPHPDDDVRGLSCIAALRLTVQHAYKAHLFNNAALDNGGTPGGIYVLPDDPGEEMRKEYLRAIESRHAGAARARKPGLLWGGADYKETAFSNVDLQLLESSKLTRDEIFEAFGVPPVMAAVYEQAHYDVADASIEIFLTQTMGELAADLVDLLNALILPQVEPGVQAAIDFLSHPVMLRVMEKKLVSLGAALRTGVPYNQAKDLLRLPLEDQSWGDRALVESTLSTVEDVLAGAGAAPDENAPADDTDSDDERQAGLRAPQGTGNREQGTGNGEQGIEVAAARDQARFEHQQVRLATLRVRPKIAGFLARQAGAVVAVLRRERQGRPEAGPPTQACPTQTAATEDEIRRVLAKVVIEIGQTNGPLRKLVSDALRANLKTAIAAELRRLGIEPDKIAKAVEAAMNGTFVRGIIRTKEIKVVNVNATTVARLRRTLADGLRQSETIQQLADRVQLSIEGADRSRALTIARTEAGQAVSTARFAAASAAGAKAKAWLTGANPRGTHIAAGRDYAPGQAIALDEPFRVGSSSLMFPRDPRGEAGEIINCNCVMVTTQKIGNGEQGTGNRRDYGSASSAVPCSLFPVPPGANHD